MITTDYIPSEKFDQFHEILCSTNGRYLSNPYISADMVRVHYTHDDIDDGRKFYVAINRLFYPLKEIRSDQWWKITYRRLINLFNWK